MTQRGNPATRAEACDDDARAERQRLAEDERREKNWKRWGPYLSERQWGTVREDYSADGNVWAYFPHEQARSRAYRWGEDGLLGLCDRQARLCFGLALWNGKDAILKERLFGLTGLEGNHGEDVKELYYYLDATPTSSYLKGLYKYPIDAYPYDDLVRENRRRGPRESEYELLDTGLFERGRYFDVTVEYAKASPEDILIRITVDNRSAEAAVLHVLPTLWFRNTWSWDAAFDPQAMPELRGDPSGFVECRHPELGSMRFHVHALPVAPDLLFTHNVTNFRRCFDIDAPAGPSKDAFHEAVVHGRREALSTAAHGTKVAAHYPLTIAGGGSVQLCARLCASEVDGGDPFGAEFSLTFQQRMREADAFYASVLPPELTPAEQRVARQAHAGLLWSKQFYHYVVRDWLEGDPAGPVPPAQRWLGRNHEWRHLYNRDVISMPDKWEYPWYAAWDVAFHMIPFVRTDAAFAKQQLMLFLREWYMHPNGQLPAYEFALGDVNPPVHAWAAWRVYKMSGRRGARDTAFLARVFQKLLLNFTWWVNRKDTKGNNLFSGGFLGLDNIGIFDRSQPLPTGGALEQADGTAWMAFYASTMLSMALELARFDAVYEDMASKFFEHFVAIVDAMNELGGTGLWDERDGFYYDRLDRGDDSTPLRTRSMVGIIPLFAVEVLREDVIQRLPGFESRMRWFLDNRKDLARHIASVDPAGGEGGHRLLAVPSRDRLVRVLRYVLDEKEFLSPYGIRSLSRVHQSQPYVLEVEGHQHRVDYAPGDSESGLFGGNSNWRGPVWFPLNYLLIEALERYHHFYGDSLRVECPTGSGVFMTLEQVAIEIAQRLTSLFLPRSDGSRPCHGPDRRYADDPHFEDLILFSEYFHGDDGRGVGASHQTGWTALVASCLETVARQRRVAASSGLTQPPSGASPAGATRAAE
ncbi:MAG TPA: glucosidase [Polyangiaceae bacterium]|nr:glucosidase [Polyangiaceae bacterium]